MTINSCLQIFQANVTVFYPIAGFPRVTGAIDSSLIPIWRPDSDEHLSVCHMLLK